MLEVLSESIRWVNLPFTVLLGMVLLYWLMVAIGIVDATMFGDIGSDLHVGSDVQADAHVELHAEAHADLGTELDGDLGHDAFSPGEPVHVGDHGGSSRDVAGHDGTLLFQTLSFLNVGQVPLMLVISVLSVFLWFGSMVSNHYLTGGSTLLALLMLVPNLAVSLVATRYFTLPFRFLFRRLNRDPEDHKPLIGQRCTIVTSEATEEFGQAEIATNGAPLLLNVRTLEQARLVKGDIAVVVRVDPIRSLYFITPLPNLAH